MPVSTCEVTLMDLIKRNLSGRLVALSLEPDIGSICVRLDFEADYVNVVFGRVVFFAFINPAEITLPFIADADIRIFDSEDYRALLAGRRIGAIVNEAPNEAYYFKCQGAAELEILSVEYGESWHSF